MEFEEQGAPPPPHATAPAEYRPHELEARERGDIQALEKHELPLCDLRAGMTRDVGRQLPVPRGTN